MAERARLKSKTRSGKAYSSYRFDFSFVKLPAFDEDGLPEWKRGVTEFSGLYFVGLPFLHTVKSGFYSGVGDDAAHVAEHIDSLMTFTRRMQPSA
jgi:putative flavoprotein involved in K+ transport